MLFLAAISNTLQKKKNSEDENLHGCSYSLSPTFSGMSLSLIPH